MGTTGVVGMSPSAVRLVVPVTVTRPLSVIEPWAVMLRLPMTSEKPRRYTWPRSISPTSLSVTLTPKKLTAPPKSLAASSVMSLGRPAQRLVVPVIERLPLSVIAPLAVTASLPLIVEAPRSMAPVSLSVTSFPLLTLTVPPKVLTASSVMSLAPPAVRLVVPVTLRAPLSVIDPLAVTARLPLIAEAPRSMPLVSLIVTFLPLTTLTAPPKLLAAESVMSLAEPAARVVVPGTPRLPLCVIGPLASTVRLLPIVSDCRTMPPAVALSDRSRPASLTALSVMFDPTRLRSPPA